MNVTGWIGIAFRGNIRMDTVKPSKIEVVRQSPMNPKQWLCQLDCGHDQYVTSKSRPTRQTLKCHKCIEKARDGERNG